MLTSSQMEAVQHKKGPCLVLAGPGSGKTLVLTRRIGQLITEDKILPEKILVITFTKAAALEMKERFFRHMGESYPVVFGTFHSVFYGMLRQDPVFRQNHLMDKKTKYQILKETAYACGITEIGEKTLERMESEIGFIKNTMTAVKDIRSDYFSDQEIRQLYLHYEARKKSYHLLDFDDLLSCTWEMFSQKKDVLTRWQQQFTYILVDEAQDMNPMQFQILRMLAAGHENLFLVGDDDQSIYGFRGASPGIMLSFLECYPRGRIIRLQENYRCGERIVAMAGNLVSYNENRFEKEIIPVRKEAGEVEVCELSDERAEAEYTADRIAELYEQGCPWDSTAVMFRRREQAEWLMEELQKRRIPFFVKDTLPNPYKHFVMEDMVSYLRLCQPLLHRRDLFRIMNRPNRWLQRQRIEREWITFETWKSAYDKEPLKDAIEGLERDILRLKKMRGTAAVTYICKKIGYERYLKETAANEEELECWLCQIENARELFRDCVSIRQMIEKWEDKRDFMDKVNELSACQKEGKVGLYTLHGAKGLEFENVFILDCDEKIIPAAKAESIAEVEEERRLFYVGMTRAKRRLYLLHSKYYRRKEMHPSRFLEEMQQVHKKDQSISSNSASSSNSSKRSSTASYSSSD